jgi:hypothetical protein
MSGRARRAHNTLAQLDPAVRWAGVSARRACAFVDRTAGGGTTALRELRKARAGVYIIT